MPATLLPRRDVDASFTYWNGNSAVNLDFTLPETEKRYEELTGKSRSVELTVQDVRGREDEFSLERNGFAYVKHPVDGFDASASEDEIYKLLIPATEKLVQEILGAHKTMTFTTRIRNVSEDTKKRAENRAPALNVHADFSPGGAGQTVNKLVADAAEREKLAQGRVLLVNVWRPLKTITKDPLAVCDWSSVDPHAQAIPLRFTHADTWHELRQWRYDDSHKWYYLSSQQPDEPLVFIQYDSEAANGAKGATTVPHSAFEDREFTTGPPRESIEIKMAVFVE